MNKKEQARHFVRLPPHDQCHCANCGLRISFLYANCLGKFGNHGLAIMTFSHRGLYFEGKKNPFRKRLNTKVKQKKRYK